MTFRMNIKYRYLSVPLRGCGRGWRQHFICDEHNTPIVRTIDTLEGTEPDKEMEAWLRAACERMNGKE